jgi:hypothetical protein
MVHDCQWMDYSGKPCWYLREDVQMDAINDSYILASFMRWLITSHITDPIEQNAILNLFTDVIILPYYHHIIPTDSIVPILSCGYHDNNVYRYHIKPNWVNYLICPTNLKVAKVPNYSPNSVKMCMTHSCSLAFVSVSVFGHHGSLCRPLL